MTQVTTLSTPQHPTFKQVLESFRYLTGTVQDVQTEAKGKREVVSHWFIDQMIEAGTAEKFLQTVATRETELLTYLGLTDDNAKLPLLWIQYKSQCNLYLARSGSFTPKNKKGENTTLTISLVRAFNAAAKVAEEKATQERSNPFPASYREAMQQYREAGAEASVMVRSHSPEGAQLFDTQMIIEERLLRELVQSFRGRTSANCQHLKREEKHQQEASAGKPIIAKEEAVQTQEPAKSRKGLVKKLLAKAS